MARNPFRGGLRGARRRRARRHWPTQSDLHRTYTAGYKGYLNHPETPQAYWWFQRLDDYRFRSTLKGPDRLKLAKAMRMPASSLRLENGTVRTPAISQFPEGAKFRPR